MIKSKDFQSGNFGRNVPDSSFQFLEDVANTKVDAGTGDYVLHFSGKCLISGGGGSQIKKLPSSFPVIKELFSFSFALF